MTLTAAIVVMSLFAYACGLATGVLATHAWHQDRDGEESIS